jgi:predicted nucleic acid-binding protein
MIVVSDTTPLCYLAVLGCLDFLPRLFGSVHCPEAVIEECRHVHAPEPLRQWIANLPGWLVVESEVGDIEPALQKALDAGEAAAIALAQRLKAQVVLMDERDGRRCALERGFAVAGTLNILAQAGRRGWCDYVATITRLKHDTNFRTTDAVIASAWETASAAKPG